MSIQAFYHSNTRPSGTLPFSRVTHRLVRSSPVEDASRRLERPGNFGLRFFLHSLLQVLFFAFLGVSSVAAQGDNFESMRDHMIDRQVKQRGINEPGVLEAMKDVPRHLFVPEPNQPQAYEDLPIAIAPGQTLSQAYVSARMISLLELQGEEKVLEVGTGSGYDAAILSHMAEQIFTIEIDRELGKQAKKLLKELGYNNVEVRIGDGYRGWPEKAPFDAILMTTAPRYLPEPLLDQLKVGGRMVIAVGDLVQDLQVITKTEDGLDVRRVSLVNLAPMTGEIRREN